MMTLLKECSTVEAKGLAPEQPKFGLSREFWYNFFAQSWARYPRILRQPIRELLARPHEVLRALIQASDQYREGEQTPPIGFFIEYAKQLVDVPRYLPESWDISLQAYAARVDKALEHRKFGLITEHFQIYDSNIWFRIREFLQGLYEFTGLPGEDTKATLFFGNYDRTPFGLHKESSHHFLFVLHGRKRIRLWPKKYFTKSDRIEHSIEYDNHNHDSILLEGNPGDILYWPSGHWHIEESAADRELSMGLSIELFMDSRRTIVGWNTIGELIQAQIQTREDSSVFFDPKNHQLNLEFLPELVKQSKRVLQEAVNDPSLDQAVEVTALNYLSAMGFTRVPVLSLESTLVENDMISGVPGSPILWMDWIDEQVVCSVNGHAFTMPDSEEYLNILKKLNCGSSGTVRKFISNCEMPHIAKQLLQKLYAHAAIRMIEPRASCPHIGPQASSLHIGPRTSSPHFIAGKRPAVQ
jgi:ribosomal protein L16 Arg81 hydroxylase